MDTETLIERQPMTTQKLRVLATSIANQPPSERKAA
jgi:hypothetical protein